MLALKETSGTKKKPSADWREWGDDTFKRRMIVASNPGMGDRRLCKLFDNERIPVPWNWEKEHNVINWHQASSRPQLRQHIHNIISTDRAAANAERQQSA